MLYGLQSTSNDILSPRLCEIGRALCSFDTEEAEAQGVTCFIRDHMAGKWQSWH